MSKSGFLIDIKKLSFQNRRPVHFKEKSMPNKRYSLLLSFPLVLLVMGCANIPKSGMPESQFSALDCPAIADQLSQARVTQAHAAQAKRDAWKIVIPFAVAARYIDASSHMNESERRATLLGQEQQAKNCAQVSG